MVDRVYTEGFPERWSMVQRDDCTLLVQRAEMSIFPLPSVAICQSPKLLQGEAWLSTAKEIAHAMAGSRERELSRIFAEFCDHCGIGPPCEEDGEARDNIRASVTWVCDRCDQTNVRPKVAAAPPLERSEAIMKREFNDRIIREGFPERWFIQDRLDEKVALLCTETPGMWPGSSCICLKPAAITTDEWLPIARQIARGYDASPPASVEAYKLAGYVGKASLEMLTDGESAGCVLHPTEPRNAVAVALYRRAGQPMQHAAWRPIAEADRSIATVQTFLDVGITLRHSHPIWVRDDDGRAYEAVWTDHRGGYWWDIEGESPVDPVEFMPHPLDPRWGDARDTKGISE